MGPGWQGAGSLVVLARLRGENHRSVFAAWADSEAVESARATQKKSRRGLQTVDCEPCFGEDVAFDVSGDGLRLSSSHRTAATAVNGARVLLGNMVYGRVSLNYTCGTQFVQKFVSEQWILSCKSLGRSLVYHL